MATTVTSAGPSERIWPYPIQGGVLVRYRQKCVDTVTGFWTSWTTTFLDFSGTEYPGSGFDATTYRVSVTYDREAP